MDNENLTEYVAWLYSAALRKTGGSYMAEEIAQETFLAALKALRRGTRPDNMRAWLLRILCNKYADLLREKYNKPQVSFEDYPYEIADENNCFAGSEDFDKMESIRRELGYLAKIHREVMVRFYMRGETLETIARTLCIPVGTVKSRLNAGRRQIREGVKVMGSYAKQSYEPDTLLMSCSGSVGPGGEPFTLAEDRLTQNVLLLAYDKPVTETELAKSLGVPVVYIEPIIEKMVAGELMSRTESGMVYTDFIIFTEKDRKAPFAKQLKLADDFFTYFWDDTSKALAELRGKAYFSRHSERAKAKLELHFCINLLMGACIDVRNEVTGLMPYADYPYRKRGGRWIAMGNKYTPGYKFNKFSDDAEFWKYSISGEAGMSINNFRDAKQLELRKYDTELGKYPDDCFTADYIKWLYELLNGVSHEDSSAGDRVLESAEELSKFGILKKDGAVSLDIPVLSRSEYNDEKRLSSVYQKPLYEKIRGEMIKMFDDGYVRLPHHLKSVPKWQQYIRCGDSVPMAVIYKAIGQGLFLQNVDYPTPASILVVEKQEQ